MEAAEGWTVISDHGAVEENVLEQTVCQGVGDQTEVMTGMPCFFFLALEMMSLFSDLKGYCK